MHWRLQRFHRWATQSALQAEDQTSPTQCQGHGDHTTQEIMEAWKQIQEQRNQLEAQELQKQQADLDQESKLAKT